MIRSPGRCWAVSVMWAAQNRQARNVDPATVTSITSAGFVTSPPSESGQSREEPAQAVEPGHSGGGGTAMPCASRSRCSRAAYACQLSRRSEEHTSELQSRRDLVCRLLLEK